VAIELTIGDWLVHGIADCGSIIRNALLTNRRPIRDSPIANVVNRHSTMTTAVNRQSPIANPIATLQSPFAND